LTRSRGAGPPPAGTPGSDRRETTRAHHDRQPPMARRGPPRAPGHQPAGRAVADRHRRSAGHSLPGWLRSRGQPDRRGHVAGGGAPGAARRGRPGERRGGVRGRPHARRLVRLHPAAGARAGGSCDPGAAPPALAPSHRLVAAGRWSGLPAVQPADRLPDRVLLLRRPAGRTPCPGREPLMTASTATKLTYRPDRLRKPTPARRVFQVFNGALLVAFALICLLPFLHVIGSSLANPGELATRAFVIIPRELTLDAYRYVLSTPTIFRAMGVSVFVTVVGTFLSLLVTSLMAYALGKQHLRGRRVINFLVVFTMLFSGGMIPLFIVVNSIGLLDSIWSLILPFTVNAFNFVIMRSFFQGIPDSL